MNYDESYKLIKERYSELISAINNLNNEVKYAAQESQPVIYYFDKPLFQLIYQSNFVDAYLENFKERIRWITSSDEYTVKQLRVDYEDLDYLRQLTDAVIKDLKWVFDRHRPLLETIPFFPDNSLQSLFDVCNDWYRRISMVIGAMDNLTSKIGVQLKDDQKVDLPTAPSDEQVILSLNKPSPKKRINTEAQDKKKRVIEGYERYLRSGFTKDAAIDKLVYDFKLEYNRGDSSIDKEHRKKQIARIIRDYLKNSEEQ